MTRRRRVLLASVLLVTFRTLVIGVTGLPSAEVLRDAILIDLALIAVPAVTAIYSVARQTTRGDVSSLLKDH